MANYRKMRLYFDRWNDRLLNARGLPVQRLDMTRGDVYQVELQVFDGGQFVVDSSGMIPASSAVDLSAYTDVVLGLKTSAQYLADGDFSSVTSGFDTTNAMHNPAAGCVAMLVVPVPAPGEYYAEIVLTASGVSMTIMSRPTVMQLHRDVVVGGETSLVTGPATGSGTAVVSAGETTKVVSYPGVTTGSVVLVSLLNVAYLTTVSAAAGINQFTISLGSSFDEDVTVAFYVAGLGAATGIAVVLAGDDQVIVTNAAVTASSVILVSLLNVTELTTVSVTPGAGEFTVKLGESCTANVSVAYYLSEL